MGFRRNLVSTLRKADRQFGILTWLRGEPRPPAGGFDLRGEKMLDWGWVCVNLPGGAKRGLDIGCGESATVPAMLALGYEEVVAIDLEFPLDRQLCGVHFIQGDFNQIALEPGFDVIVACSAVEHIGLCGRYGAMEDEDGDLKAMRKIRTLLKDDGLLILTVPVGTDAIYKPWHRVYGKARMGLLLDGFQIIRSHGFVKEPWGPWQRTSLDVALSFPASAIRYALGQMVLKSVA